VAEWVEAGWVIGLPPVRRFSKSHRRIVVVEPHADDAALSVGEILRDEACRADVTILTIMGRSNFTTETLRGRDSLPETFVSRLRKQEAELFARLIGARSVVKTYRDAPLRFAPGRTWKASNMARYARQYPAWAKRQSPPAEIGRVARLILRALIELSPHEVWIPLGIGDQVDHRLVRDAGRQIFRAPPPALAHVKVCHYEDLPYAYHHSVAPRKTGRRMVVKAKNKAALLAPFASQFKVSAIAPAVQREILYSQNVPGNTC
jgi:LmbE family N-acetylglucosaminyl deacetylase